MARERGADVQRIRLMWPDHLGIARGKYLSARREPEGTGHCIALFSLGFDRNMTPHEGAFYHEGTPDLEARFKTADRRPSWETGTAIVIPDLYKDGTPVMMAPRHVLRRAVDALKEAGYTAKIGIELEAYLMAPGEHGQWRPIDTPGSYVYGTGTSVDPTGVLDDLMRTAEDVGLKLESVHSEYDVSQFELTLEHDDPLAACDDAFVLKVLAREVAARHGCLFTFMGKPVSDRGGSGTHVNVSLWKSGENAFADGSAEDGLSNVARHAIGGLLEHHAGLAAVCAPTVNAYKRLLPGQMVGLWANWGYDHRGAAVRVPPVRGRGTRLEHRLSDGGVGPHIATAAVLQAVRLGLVEKSDPGPAETGDGWETVDTEQRAASSLAGALDDLTKDAAMVEALGKDFVDAFVVVKRAEWERYLRHTTDWEIGEYLHFL